MGSIREAPTRKINKRGWYTYIMNIIFTHHAEDRLSKRKILKQEVIDSVRYPDKTIKKHGLIYFQKLIERGNIEIVCERIENNIKVITLYWI